MSDTLTHSFPIQGAADLLRLYRFKPQRYPYLLQSVVYGTPQSRYDILFAFPETVLESRGGGNEAPFLERLDALWQRERLADYDTGELPFGGGWFLYLGYELAAEVEPTLARPMSDSLLPDAFAARVPAAWIVDHQQQRLTAVVEPGREQLLARMVEDYQSLPEVTVSPPVSASLIHEDPDQIYLDAVERARRYIYDGDVFQVNLSRSWQLQPEPGCGADRLYEQLCHNNPAPFAALVTEGDASIISSSPERLVSVVGDEVSTRPIAGTRPRGEDAESDQAYLDALIGHPKERAEHVMLIDLERNDLGRVCRPGSVEVDELMVLESYAHVHHIVSNVKGRLREGVAPGEVIRAVFPGGTITGCPKVRCMEIIHELEQVARGPYTGSLGYLGHNGDMDLNILIRTMLLEGDKLTFRTGAGIVADSVAQAELEETRAKAKGLLRALGADAV